MLAYVAAHDELLGSGHSFSVLTVVAPVPPEVTHYLDRSTIASYYQEQAQKVLAPIKAFAGQNAWQVDLRHETGRPADVISEAAKGFDMVILGSHGHSTLGNLFLGSVASGVLAGCKTPTLIIR